MKRIIEMLGNLLLMGCACAGLYIFLSIMITGGYMAVERNSAILYAEIGLFALVLIVSINRTIDDWRK